MVLMFNFFPRYQRLLSSVDNLYKHLGPKNVGPDLDPNCLTLWWYSWKIFFLKSYLKKKNPDDK